MLVAKGGVVAGVTINTGAVVSNAGIVKANSALSAVIGGVVTNATPSKRWAAARLSNFRQHNRHWHRLGERQRRAR